MIEAMNLSKFESGEIVDKKDLEQFNQVGGATGVMQVYYCYYMEAV